MPRALRGLDALTVSECVKRCRQRGVHKSQTEGPLPTPVKQLLDRCPPLLVSCAWHRVHACTCNVEWFKAQSAEPENQTLKNLLACEARWQAELREAAKGGRLSLLSGFLLRFHLSQAVIGFLGVGPGLR